MLGGCWGIEGQYGVQCLIRKTKCVHYVWCFCTFLGKFIDCVVSTDVCMGLDFLDGDVGVRCFYVMYYVGCEEFIGVFVLGGGASSVVKDQEYDVEVLYRYESIRAKCFSVFYNQKVVCIIKL